MNEKFTSINFENDELTLNTKESDYKKHLSTRKHKMETNGNKTRQNSPYTCGCGIEYKTRSGLFKHNIYQR